MATVLVVDDAKIMRLSVKNMLTELGHEVIAEAETGYKGLKAYEKHLPDFVTMDITMPGEMGITDGIEAVKEIIDFHPAAKIVMITSHGEQEKVIRAIKNGASNYLLKPINITKFEEVISNMLDK